MENCEDDYSSEDDEDYVPGKGEDEEDIDYGSGEEEAPLDPENIINVAPRGARQKGKKGKKTQSKKEAVVVNEADCTADFLDDLFPTYTYTPTATSAVESTAKVIEPEKEDQVPTSSTKMTTITEVFDFAGDEVKVQREVTEEERRKHEENEKKQENKKPVKRSGLGDVLIEMTKKKKISTIDKTVLDWNSFKNEHDLHEELETFNKGKGGYLKRMEFLQQADVRQFEQEKEMRQSKRP